MQGKSRLFAVLGRDHQRLAELAYKEGDRKRARDLYAKAGNLAEAVGARGFRRFGAHLTAFPMPPRLLAVSAVEC